MSFLWENAAKCAKLNEFFRNIAVKSEYLCVKLGHPRFNNARLEFDVSTEKAKKTAKPTE